MLQKRRCLKVRVEIDYHDPFLGGREVTEGNRGRFPSVRGRRGPSGTRAPPYSDACIDTRHSAMSGPGITPSHSTATPFRLIRTFTSVRGVIGATSTGASKYISFTTRR